MESMSNLRQAKPPAPPRAATGGVGASACRTPNRCPACDGADFQLLFTASDRLYHTTAEKFRVVECKRCRLMQLAPKPGPAELESYYPKDYWFAPERSAAGRIEEMYRRFVLLDHVRFVEKAVRESGESGPVLDV